MNEPLVAYFTMEIALDSGMPTYAGGLGVLAGDTVRSAAELKVPMVVVTLLHRKGYFRQKIDASGWQREEPCDWDIGRHLEEQSPRVSVTIEGRAVSLRAWKHEVRAPGGFSVPVFFLDTDLPENAAWDRTLTHYLYGGDACYRICQEVVLGIGGVRMLRALGCTGLTRYHMNEGHAALLGLELLDESAHRAGRSTFTHDDVESVRRQCVFTTHTPVASGHDQFPLDLATRVLGRAEVTSMREVFCCDGTLNMTFLALNLSHFINGVAKKHAETSQLMFAHYKIDSITNGVHAATWTSPPFQELFDRHIPGWRGDNFSLRFAHSLPLTEIWDAHQAARRLLAERVRRDTGVVLDPHVLTLGFARRATAYKRSDLLVSDVERLKRIAASAGRLQIIYGGKAHPNDCEGKEAIQRIIRVRERLGQDITMVYLPDYDLDLARLMVAGADVWLNTPQPPLEASGTSGMKAALNGVPSLSVLDGWWIEGWIEGGTGWAVGESCTMDRSHPDRNAYDAAALYDKLEQVVIPLFYRDRDRFTEVMRHCISLNGSFFNTQRMVSQYVIKAYFE
ncbi:alpha-glucan family phosphorylase [Prosthecobacter sp.]|uniref:alpha-glucan family phosphorylase n=1 Tax=Prosthecobacter sp. TaxID=1965333 RepID=UPI0037832DFF